MDTNDLSDGELVVAGRASDKRAIEQLIQCHWVGARQTALRMLAESDLAEEVAQQAMLHAYLSLESLRDPNHFAPWLHGIVRNLCRNWLRRQQRNRQTIEVLLDDIQLSASGDVVAGELDPYQLVAAQEGYALVQSAIDSLSSKNRAALLLFYYEQLSLEEIATQLGASVSAIKGRLHQARKQLLAQLAPRFGHDWETPPPIDARPANFPMKERRTQMIEITRIYAIPNEASQNVVLYLLDSVGNRLLRIWVGAFEGEQIYALLHKLATTRPVTYQFFAAVLDKMGGKLEEVRIETLKETTFYAVAKVRTGKQVHEIDARPSDALALALQTKCPIYVAEEVMSLASQALPQPFVEQSWLKEETQTLAAAGVMNDSWLEKLQDEPVAHRIVLQAQKLATTLNHNYIGTEHLLLSLLQTENGATKELLGDFNLTIEKVSESITRLVGRGATAPASEPKMAPRVGHVLALAAAEAQGSTQKQITQLHLLAGLIREGQGMAMKIMRDLGADPFQIWRKVNATTH